MSWRTDVRVCGALLRPSAAIVLAVAAVIVWAGYLAVTAPEDLRGPYVVLLLCQSFLASTGYAPRARRGHFDQLLTGLSSRVRFSLVHAAMSMVLGVAAWWTVSLLDAIGGGGHWPVGLTPHGLTAVVYISSLAWAMSVPFSRYSSGLVWLIVTIGLAGSGRLLALRNSYASASETWTSVWRAAGSALVFPPLVVGELSSPPATVVAALLLAGLAAIAAGVVFISRYGLALEDVE